MAERSDPAHVARAQIEHFRLLVSGLPIMIWSTDREFRITSVGGALLDSLNINSADVIGQSVFAEQDPEHPVDVYAYRALAGESVQYENEWRARRLSVHWQPLRDSAGAIIGTVALAQDVTNERRTTAALQESRADLRESLRQLQQISTRLNEVREQEYGRLSREVHDHFGQSLTSMRLDLEEVERRLDRGELAGARERLSEIKSVVGTFAQDIHRLAADLRPPLLDECGLDGAVQSYLHDVRQRAQLTCHFHGPQQPLHLAPDRATALFRILQEAVTNVIRHARATRLDVRLAGDGAFVRLEVRDDGCGISEQARLRGTGTGMGLASMRDRAQLLGGCVHVAALPGGGTLIDAVIPRQEALGD